MFQLYYTDFLVTAYVFGKSTTGFLDNEGLQPIINDIWGTYHIRMKIWIAKGLSENECMAIIWNKTLSGDYYGFDTRSLCVEEKSRD